MQPTEHDQINVLDYARVVWRYRWVIFLICIATLAGTFVVTLRMPKVYESTVTLLSPREGLAGGALGGLAGSGLLQQVLPVSSLTPHSNMLVSILKSRTMAQAVVERFGLRDRYRLAYLEDAIKTLQQATDITLTKEGVIVIKVEEIDHQLAAEVANFYADHLDRLVSRFGTGEAGRQRVFIKEQLALAKDNLAQAEEKLRRFQERNRAVVLEEQTRGAIDAAARLKGEILATEVQLQVMRNFATDTNPDVVSLRRRVEEMKRQLTQMQYGDGVGTAAPGRERRDFSVPVAKVPEIGLELVRLTRDVKIQDTVVTLMTQQLEQARIAESRDLPIVQVLDRAVPAERPTKPRLRLNLLVAGIASLVAGLLLVFSIEFVRTIDWRPGRA